MHSPTRKYSPSTTRDLDGRLKDLRGRATLTPYAAAHALNLMGHSTSPQAVLAAEEGRAVGDRLVYALQTLYMREVEKQEEPA